MFFSPVSLLIGNYLFLSHPNRLFCFFLPDLQRSSFLLSQHHSFGKIPAYPRLPGLSQMCRDLSPVRRHQPWVTHQAWVLPGLAETDRQSHSLTPRGSEGAFAFVWAQVSEHHQAVLPEGRRDPGDVRHHGRVLLRGGAELDEQRPGESGT